MIKRRKSIYIILAISMTLVVSTTSNVLSKDVKKENIIARGENIKITEQYVTDYQIYYKKRGIHPASRKELLKSAIRTFLFSEKAQKLGLNDDKSDETNFTLNKRMKYAKDYVQYILKNYELEDKVIVSYYRSYPEKFEKKYKNGTQKLIPLNNKVKTNIQNKILMNIKKQIINQKFMSLMGEYKIQFVN